MKNILIIGFGRFGEVLANVFKDDFYVMASSRRDISSEANKLGIESVDIKYGIKNADIIIYSVPISSFKEIFISHLPLLKEKKTKSLIIDVQSVKVIPKQIYDKYLPDNCDLLLTHPMFGPDSLKNNGLKGLRIMMDHHKCPEDIYDDWKNYFVKKELEVIELSSKEHDLMAARSQGLTFFLARVLEDFKFQKTPIDTLWVDKLHEIAEALNNDTWQLFSDLQSYNPYTKDMRVQLDKSLYKIFNNLLPQRIEEGNLIIGIQGGAGSFNKKAALKYVEDNKVDNYELVYLHTAENVLKELHYGNIDIGQFAVHNSIGGIDIGAIQAMAKYKFQIIERYNSEAGLKGNTSFLMASR